MGADFVFSIVPLDRKYDYWQEVIREVTDDELNRFLDVSNIGYRYEDLEPEDIRQEIDEAFQTVMLSMPRDTGWRSPDGVTTYAIPGGMSWGDDPTDSFQYFEICESFMDWHDRKGDN